MCIRDRDCTSERVNRRLLQGKADGTDSVRSPQRLIMTKKVQFEGTKDDLFGPVYLITHHLACMYHVHSAVTPVGL